MGTGVCYNCKRPGHWAKDCDKSECPKCLVRLDRHTEAGILECAWRGPRCTTCNRPPHPDGAPGRCARYTHSGDTEADQYIRRNMPWHRSADPDSFYRHPGDPIPLQGPDPAGSLDPWRNQAEELMARYREDRDPF
jgi:Zinc knuckle